MVEAIAKLVEAIRDPRPRARGKTVWPGRAERAGDAAGEKRPEERAGAGPGLAPRTSLLPPPHKLKAIEEP